jgi:hypothetical protein
LLGDARELSFGSGVVLAVTALLVARVPLYYFDGHKARELSDGSVRRFANQLVDGSLFATPEQ